MTHPTPETLRTYAVIFEMPKRQSDGVLRPPTEIELAAAAALRFQSEALVELSSR